MSLFLEKSPITEAIWAQRQSFSALIAFSIAINLIGLTPSIYMLQVYDRVLASQNLNTLYALSILALFLYALCGVIDHFRTTVLVRISNAIDSEIHKQLHETVFKHALAHQGKASSGQAIRDFAQFRQFLTSQGALALLDTPWIIFYIALLFFFHPAFGFLAIGGALLSWGLNWLNQHFSNPPLAQANKLSIQSANEVENTLRNADVIQGMGMLNNMQQRWEQIHGQFLQQQTHGSDHASVWTHTSKNFRLLLQSAALGLGAWLVLQQSITPGMMIAGSILMGKALAPLDLLISANKSMASTREAYQRLVKMLKANPQTAPQYPLPLPSPHIQCRGLYAKAPQGDNWVIKNIELDIPAGTCLGVIGSSGAGKSALLKVILGIWKHQEGRLLLGGADLHQYDRNSLGPHLGYLPQQVELFEGTVAENISRFSGEDPEKVTQAAQRAGVHNSIISLPQGYNTRLAAQGHGLSGGMQQRIGLARALYGEPRLLVLDEPNSSLDDVGEQALIQAIVQHHRAGNTVVLVTHKRPILRACNQVLVMQNGEVALYGPTATVLKELQGPSPGAAPNSLDHAK